MKRLNIIVEGHELEVLSPKNGYETYFQEEEAQKKQDIVQKFDNPEDINVTSEGTHSKRLTAINESYEEVIESNLIALGNGMDRILEKYPFFKE